MGLEPITVELSDFSRLELLRDEDDSLTEELAAVEKEIRDQMLEAERGKYLLSLSQYYNDRQTGDASKLQELESRRQLIHATLEVVRSERQKYEEALGSPERKRGGARKARSAGAHGTKSTGFDSFENFRQSRG